MNFVPRYIIQLNSIRYSFSKTNSNHLIQVYNRKQVKDKLSERWFAYFITLLYFHLLHTICTCRTLQKKIENLEAILDSLLRSVGDLQKIKAHE